MRGRSTSTRSSRRRSILAAMLLASTGIAACSSPTGPGESVVLEGEVLYQGSSTNVVALPKTGVVRITVLDLRKMIWDVTLGDSTPSLTLGIGRDLVGGCNVTGQLVVHENDAYFWSLQEGSQCFVLSDPGSIPTDGVLAYSIRLDLPD